MERENALLRLQLQSLREENRALRQAGRQAETDADVFVFPGSESASKRARRSSACCCHCGGFSSSSDNGGSGRSSGSGSGGSSYDSGSLLQQRALMLQLQQQQARLRDVHAALAVYLEATNDAGALAGLVTALQQAGPDYAALAHAVRHGPCSARHHLVSLELELSGALRLPSTVKRLAQPFM